MTTSDSSKKRDAQLPSAELQGVDRLFGRDLRSEGWFVDPDGLQTRAPDARQSPQGEEEPLDPALIWAMRWRRR